MPLSRLTPTSRRLVGLLFMVMCVLLVLAALLRFWVNWQEWKQGGWVGVDSTNLTISVLMLGLALLVGRFGWRVRRDGRISDEPGGGRIS